MVTIVSFFSRQTKVLAFLYFLTDCGVRHPATAELWSEATFRDRGAIPEVYELLH